MTAVSAGEIILADHNNNIIAPTWTDWSASVAWTSSGTAPVFGNAVKTAEYRRPGGANIVDAWMSITFGTTSGFGTGVYFFSIPLAAPAAWVGKPIGVARALDAGVKETGGVVWLNSATTIRISAAPITAGTSDNWGSSTPFTWGNTDQLHVAFSYRPA